MVSAISLTAMCNRIFEAAAKSQIPSLWLRNRRIRTGHHELKILVTATPSPATSTASVQCCFVNYHYFTPFPGRLSLLPSVER